MASIIKANELQDFGGNSIITSDGAGNVTVNAAAMKNTPAFEARVSVDQSISHNTATKVQCGDETFDTDGYYDNVTNYRFTPLVAGKYYFYFGLKGFAGGSDPDGVRFMIIKPYKNGSLVRDYDSVDTDPNELRTGVVTASAVIELNGSTDYLEFYATVYAQNLSSTGVQILMHTKL